MRHVSFSAFLTLVYLLAFLPTASAQYLVGYHHNWAAYLPLDQIDNRYTVINLAFPETQAGTDYNMYYTPCCGETQAGLISKIQALQAAGKKVNISIGGATIPIALDNQTEINVFVSSMGNILNTYGLDGVDIDLEGSSLSVSASSTIANPTDPHVVNMIAAIQQIMANYQSTHGKKMFLSAAPETAFVQGGQSAWGGIWGAYLPLLHALRNDMDLLHVQLYNSGSMYGLGGGVYSQGTADFLVSQTEAVIQGFTVSGSAGAFIGFPASKVSIGLPACPSAAGGGYTTPAVVKSAVDYLRGTGPKPGSYTRVGGPYPSLGGLMTWSINWDASATCNSSAYQFATNYQSLFNSGTCAQPDLGADLSSCSLSFPHTLNSGTTANTNVTYTWKNLTTGSTLISNAPTATSYAINAVGSYQVIRDSSTCSKSDNILIFNNLQSPALPTSEVLCAVLPMTLAPSNLASFPSGTAWQWYKNNAPMANQTSSTLTNIRAAGSYELTAQSGSCASAKTTTITSSLPNPVDGCAGSGQTVTLGLTSTGAGPYGWYDLSAGGTALATGTSFTTPPLTASKIYYVQDGAALGQTITGPASTVNGLGTLQNYTSPTQLTFNAIAPFKLKKLTVYPLIWCSTHTFSFEIRNAAGAVLANGAQSFSISDDDNDCGTVHGAIELTLSNGGVDIPQGSGFQIVQTGTIGFNFWEGSVAYPMNYSPYFTIVSGSSSSRYIAAHRWDVSGGSCARLPVEAAIDPSCQLILAVDLSGFSATLLHQSVRLQWIKDNEKAYTAFTVERRTEQGQFGAIAQLGAKDSEQHSYVYFDKNISPNTTYYYRIRQETANETVDFTPIEVVKTGNQLNAYQVFPNPATSSIYVVSKDKNQFEEEQTSLQLINTEGRVVRALSNFGHDTGLDTADLPRGLYFVLIKNELTVFRTQVLLF